MWTSEIPSEPGWYLWRFFPPSEPPVIGPFMVYEIANSKRLQELSLWRETGEGGLWDYYEWAQRVSSIELPYKTEYLRIGGLDINIEFIRAFRDLYDAALMVRRDLDWKPDFDDSDSTHFHMLSTALNAIHKEK